MAEIKTSLDWSKVQIELEAPIYRMNRYTGDMLKMSNAIGSMVKKLSEEEINCRRHQKQTRLHVEQLAKINEEIANYERMLTFAVLLGS